VPVIELDERWSITGHLNGGYLAAVAGQAASEHFGGAPALTISAHYLEAVRGGGPADLDVVPVRTARLSTARVTLARGGELCAEFLVTTGSPRPSDVQLNDLDPFDGPDWENSASAGPNWSGPGMELLDTLHVRLNPRDGAALAGGTPTEHPVINGWICYRDERPVDQFLAMASWDVLPPTIWCLGIPGGIPTVAAQISLYPGEIVGRLASRVRGQYLRNGIMDETAVVWDESGRVVATSRQTAVYLPPRS
jgi:hypothetical protein